MKTVFQQIPLKELVKAHYGKALKKEDRDDAGSIKVYGSSGHVGQHTSALCDYATLIIGRKGSVGEVVWAPEGGWIIDTAYYIEIINSKILDLRFLYYALKRANLAQRSITTSIPGLNRDDFYSTKIPLPLLAEQKRIAAILDKADQLRQKRQQAITLADDFLRSVFLDMFGDPVTNPKGWDTKELDTCLSFLTSGSRGWAKYYAETGSQFIRIQNVGKNKLLLDDMAYVNAPDGAEAKRTRVQYRDVLLSITADLGRSALVTEDIAGGYINQHLALLRVDEEKLNPRFLSAFLSSRGGVQQFELKNKSAVKSGLNFNDIKTVKLILPPIALQDQYEAAYKHIEMFSAQLQRGLQSTSCLFNSLSQKAFAGEL